MKSETQATEDSTDETQRASDSSPSPCSEFLAWSHAAGYSTCTSDIQLALWDAWRAGQKRTRELLVVWEMTIRNRNGITWNEMDAGDTLRLRKSIDELRSAIIPNSIIEQHAVFAGKMQRVV